MSEQRRGKPEELIRAKKLIDEGKHDEALELMKKFEENEEHPLQDIVSCHLLKCNLLFQQGKYEDVITLAEQTYKESLGLGKNLLSIDALMVMPHPLLWLYRLDKAFDIIKQEEELLNTLTEELPVEYKQREADIAYNKAKLYFWGKNEVGLALEQAERSLALREESGSKQQISQSLRQMAWIISNGKGELDRGLKYAKRALSLSEENNHKYNVAWSLNTMGMVHSFKVKIDRSILLFEQGLLIFKELNDKVSEAWSLNNLGESYRMRGEFDRAIECLEQGLVLSYETGNLFQAVSLHDYLIQISLEKGDLERSQHLLHEMEKIINQLKDKQLDLRYFFNKALILKNSTRARNRVKAEELFKQILEDEDLDYELKVRTILNLCELLFVELRMTNDVEVLDEIEPLIARLSDIAEKSQSYWILCENYLLQAKLSLLNFNLKRAQRFLTQAHQIAERFGLTQLATKIASESDDLLKKLDLWENLKESGSPMVDRIELARLDEKIVKMIQKRPILTVQVSEERIAVSKEKKICLVCRGDVLRFSYICECGAIYCGNCAKALTNLENVCWACEVPIDFLKPVKPYKDEEGIVEMGEKSKKK